MVMSACSVVVAVGSGLAENRFFFNRLFRNTSSPFELIVVDNGTADGTAAYLNELPNRKLIRFPIDMGLARAWNSALRIATGKQIAFVRTSAVLPPEWLQTLLAEAAQTRRPTVVQPINLLTLVKHPSIFYRLLDQAEDIGESSFTSEEELLAVYRGGYDQFARALARRFGSVKIGSSTAGCLLVQRDIFQAGYLFTEGFISTASEVIGQFISTVTAVGRYKVIVTPKLYIHS